MASETQLSYIYSGLIWDYHLKEINKLSRIIFLSINIKSQLPFIHTNSLHFAHFQSTIRNSLYHWDKSSNIGIILKRQKRDLTLLFNVGLLFNV